MDDIQVKLKESAKQIVAALEDRQRLRSVLSDGLSGNRLQLNLLLNAYDSDIPVKIRNSVGVPDRNLFMQGLVQSLTGDYGITEEAASWAIEAWCQILEISLPSSVASPASAPVVLSASSDMDLVLSQYEIILRATVMKSTVNSYMIELRKFVRKKEISKASDISSEAVDDYIQNGMNGYYASISSLKKRRGVLEKFLGFLADSGLVQLSLLKECNMEYSKAVSSVPVSQPTVSQATMQASSPSATGANAPVAGKVPLQVPSRSSISKLAAPQTAKSAVSSATKKINGRSSNSSSLQVTQKPPVSQPVVSRRTASMIMTNAATASAHRSNNTPSQPISIPGVSPAVLDRLLENDEYIDLSLSSKDEYYVIRCPSNEAKAGISFEDLEIMPYNAGMGGLWYILKLHVPRKVAQKYIQASCYVYSNKGVFIRKGEESPDFDHYNWIMILPKTWDGKCTNPFFIRMLFNEALSGNAPLQTGARLAHFQSKAANYYNTPSQIPSISGVSPAVLCRLLEDDDYIDMSLSRQNAYYVIRSPSNEKKAGLSFDGLEIIPEYSIHLCISRKEAQKNICAKVYVYSDKGSFMTKEENSPDFDHYIWKISAFEWPNDTFTEPIFIRVLFDV